MSFALAEKIANAVLYEGYMLYPYRPSALKNQQRWNFGTLYPRQYEEVRRCTERSSMHVECLLKGPVGGRIDVRARFLQLNAPKDISSWKEASERSLDFQFQLGESEGQSSFVLVGETRGSIRFTAETLNPQLQKLAIEFANDSEIKPSATREEALQKSLLSAHLILHAGTGAFVSLLDPPEDLRSVVTECKSAGCFPVLVGEAEQRNLLLCSPIILYDYPQIAPESAGDFFDGTEMDEMLTLRVITMTDEEKQEIRSSDTRVQSLLERTERTAREQLMKTHGTIRSMKTVNPNE